MTDVETAPLFSVPMSATRHGARRHYLLPDMGFACGRIMLDDECREDPWVMGPRDWCWVTCPECHALGLREVRRLTHRSQKPVGHECTPDLCEWMAER